MPLLQKASCTIVIQDYLFSTEKLGQKQLTAFVLERFLVLLKKVKFIVHLPVQPHIGAALAQAGLGSNFIAEKCLELWRSLSELSKYDIIPPAAS